MTGKGKQSTNSAGAAEHPYQRAQRQNEQHGPRRQDENRRRRSPLSTRPHNRSRIDGPVVPTLIYDDVPGAVAWLGSVFGFVPRIRAGDGHAQLAVGRGGIMLGQSRSEEHPATTFGPPTARRVSQSLMVPVDDVDGHHARVVAAGARVLRPPTDHPYGERQYTVLDVEGHRWTFSQSIADVDPAAWGARAAV